jgi:hypothetical protein
MRALKKRLASDILGLLFRRIYSGLISVLYALRLVCGKRPNTNVQRLSASFLPVGCQRWRVEISRTLFKQKRTNRLLAPAFRLILR